MVKRAVPPSPSSSPKTVVILVHGTFAPRTKWAVDPDSLLRAAIAARVEGEVAFKLLDWGGANTHSARQAAGEKLAGAVAEARDGGATDVFLVSHSHGGNVALYGLRPEPDDLPVSGVVTMNTPFLCVTSREPTPLIWGLAIGTAVIGTLLSLLLFYSWYSSSGLMRAYMWKEGFWAWIVAFLKTLLVGLPGLALLFGLWAGLIILAEEIAARIKNARAAALQRLNPPINSSTPVLCLWSTGDEVLTVFNIIGALSNIPFAFLHPLVFLLAFLVANGLLLAGLLPMPFSGFEKFSPNDMMELPGWLSFVSDFGEWYYNSFLSLIHYLSVSLLYVAGVCLALLLAALLLNLVLRTLPVDFRLQYSITNMLVRLSFSLVPIRSHHTEFHEFDSGPTFLKHSAIYTNPEVLEQVSKWIAGRCQGSADKS